jgi:hypothetical protein
VKDKGTGAENLIWLAGRQSGRAHPSSLAADDILAALTGRIAELEARVSEILAEVEPELPPVDSKQRGALSASKPDAGRGTDKARDARVDADDELTRASEERRMLANEMRLLREAFQEARRSQLSAGPRANTVEAQVAPELRAAIADEMRSLLTELLADFRSRALPPRPVEHVPAKSEPIVQVVAAAPPIVEEVVEDLRTAPVVDVVATEATPIVEHVDEPAPRTSRPVIDENVEHLRAASALVDMLATNAAPVEASDSIVEHVDELVRPTTKPLIANPVADLQRPEPVATAGASALAAGAEQQGAAIVEEPEDLLRTESAPSIDTPDLQVGPPAPSTVDEHVFGPAEPLAPIIDDYVEELPRTLAPPQLQGLDVGPALAKPIEPIIDEHVEVLHEPEAPPMGTIELSSAPVEPIIDEYSEQLRRPEAPPPVEPSEPIVQGYIENVSPDELIQPIVDDFAVPASDLTMTSAPPPTPDARLAALWDAAPLPAESQTVPLSPPEPTSFIADDFIADTRALEVPDAPYPPQELLPEQTIDFVPPPLVEFAPPVEFSPPPSVEFPAEPPAIVEPETEVSAEQLVARPEMTASFSSLFPELTAADERGLHQIQVVISPIHSFPRLLETERRIRALSTVNALHLRDFRNGVATLTVSVGEAISPAEFGAVIQMLESLHLRLEGTTQSSVELRAEDEPPTS